ncbi:acyl-CoA dehydrogenase [Streptomyces sp. NPDC004296]|uniref:acyl-CoA dehydrogenase n=1 Tax=Streptomyces sp. NPDC004296 TaxID=3364697 RepID=UPI003687BB62
MTLTSPSTTPAADNGAADALSDALFADHRIHAPWRTLLRRPDMHYQSGLTTAEQTDLSYQRLRQWNGAIDSPLVLAMDPIRLAAAHEWAALVDGGTLASLLSIHVNLHLGSLAEAWHDSGRLLDDVLAMRSIGIFAVTEVAYGSDAAAMKTTATRCPDNGTFVLNTPSNAAQKFMPNASMHGGRKTAVVGARLIVDGTDHGPVLFHVPLSGDDGPLPGINIRPLPERTGGGLDHCLISFNNVRLPAHALLEGPHGSIDGNGTFRSELPNRRERFLAAIDRVTPGKMCMSAAACGVSRGALAIAIRYGHHRHISGPGGTKVPLVAHRTHYAPLISGLATVYAMTLLHRRTLHAWAARDGESNRTALTRDIALTKSFVTWRARSIVTDARERCGAHALFPGAGIAPAAPALEGAITAEGDNTAIRAKAAGEMLLDGWTAQDPWDQPIVTTLDPTETSLADLRQLLVAAQDLATTCARTSQREATPDRLAQWNAVSQAAIEAADAYISGAAGDAFLAAITDCEQPSARFLLEALCRLFLLQELQPYAAQLQAHGLLTAAAVRQLPRAVSTATQVLVPHMLTLTDAFALPEEYLASVALAGPDYQDIYDYPGAPWDRGPEAGSAA